MSHLLDIQSAGCQRDPVAIHDHRAAIGARQKFIDRSHLHINEALLQRSGSGQAGCFPHGLFRPISIEAAQLGERADISDGVIYCLGMHWITRILVVRFSILRSEESRVGTEGVMTCRSRWTAYI